MEKQYTYLIFSIDTYPICNILMCYKTCRSKSHNIIYQTNVYAILFL